MKYEKWTKHESISEAKIKQMRLWNGENKNKKQEGG